MFGVPIEALVSLKTVALLLEVLAYRSLLLYVLVQKCAIISIPTIATQPERANLQLVLALIVLDRDSLLNTQDLTDTLLTQELRALVDVHFALRVQEVRGSTMAIAPLVVISPISPTGSSPASSVPIVDPLQLVAQSAVLMVQPTAASSSVSLHV